MARSLKKGPFVADHLLKKIEYLNSVEGFLRKKNAETWGSGWNEQKSFDIGEGVGAQ
jgi:hypothetical protein